SRSFAFPLAPPASPPPPCPLSLHDALPIYVDADAGRFLRAEVAAPPEVSFQRIALDQLHDEVRKSTLDVRVEHGRDTRMLQPCEGVRLTLESLERVSILL